MSTPPIPQTMVSQSGMLSRSPGAKNLPSRPMMMPAMITPITSTDDPFHLLGTACSSVLREARPAEGAIQHGKHRTTGVRGLLLWICGPIRSRTAFPVPLDQGPHRSGASSSTVVGLVYAALGFAVTGRPRSVAVQMAYSVAGHGVAALLQGGGGHVAAGSKVMSSASRSAVCRPGRQQHKRDDQPDAEPEQHSPHGDLPWRCRHQ